MPNIRSYNVNVISTTHAQLTLVTYEGTTLIDILKTTGPTRITITRYHDGLQVAQTILSNPPASQVEAQVDAAVSAMLPGRLQFRSHLVSVTPLVVVVHICDIGATIPTNWWPPARPNK